MVTHTRTHARTHGYVYVYPMHVQMHVISLQSDGNIEVDGHLKANMGKNAGI